MANVLLYVGQPEGIFKTLVPLIGVFVEQTCQMMIKEGIFPNDGNMFYYFKQYEHLDIGNTVFKHSVYIPGIGLISYEFEETSSNQGNFFILSQIADRT